MMIKKVIFIYLILLNFNLEAQPGARKFNLTVNAVFTTSAKIYLNPNSSDMLIRNSNFVLQNIFNPQVELRYMLIDDIYLGISTEYMTKTSTGDNLTVFVGNRTVTIPVEDGFRMVPIELTGYYLLPFSTDRFHFHIGGGAGYYFGSHIRKFGDAEVDNAGRKFAYGIHVVISTDYFFRDNFSLRGEMKFRDPQFNVTSRYNKNIINFKGETITLTRNAFDSKINVDGVTFILGLAFHF